MTDNQRARSAHNTVVFQGLSVLTKLDSLARSYELLRATFPQMVPEDDLRFVLVRVAAVRLQMEEVVKRLKEVNG